MINAALVMHNRLLWALVIVIKVQLQLMSFGEIFRVKLRSVFSKFVQEADDISLNAMGCFFIYILNGKIMQRKNSLHMHYKVVRLYTSVKIFK